MLINRPGFRIAMMTVSVALIAVLYYQLSGKFARVSGCRARFAQLELIGSQITKNETDLAVREKALDAAEAQLNTIKQ